MAVIAPPRQPDSRDAKSTVEPDRGGEALIEEAKQHARRRRRRVAVTGIVAALAVVGATVLGFGFARSTPAGGPELPVARADLVPAYPVASAELVASLYTHWSVGAGDHWIYVYDDGRVVSHGRGWVQQRLTPDGVELLRAGIIASGILAPGRYTDAQDWGPGAFVQLRVDGVLTVAWRPGPADDDAVDTFDRSIRHLIGFENWLPAEAWAQRETTAYEPSGYAVCADGGRRSLFATAPERDAVLAHLPEAAAAVLAAGPRFLTFDAETDAFIASGSTPSSDVVGCRHLTPAQAQFVVDALVRGGWGVEDSGPPPDGTRVLLAERERSDPFDMWSVVPGVGRLGMAFGPILPHGVPESANYG